MLLTRMSCDGCGRKPNVVEWFQGELYGGYPDWRHPAIAFKEAGCYLSYDNRAKGERMFLQLFGRPMPEESSFLCPHCQALVAQELPALWEADEGPDLRDRPREREFMGQYFEVDEV